MQKTLKLSGLIQTEAWLETIEIVQDTLGEKELIFLKYRREAAYTKKHVKGRPAWVVYVQHHYSNEMEKGYGTQPEKFWLSERTLKVWWASMVETTARVALKKHCCKNSGILINF